MLINTLLHKKAEQIVEQLKAQGLTLSTAESCTGGLVASEITNISGASEVFELGIVSYSNRIKNELLEVRKETLDKYGAVSEQTAKEMAINIRKKANADFGISVTGVAGPSSSEGHPAGYVFIAVASKEKCTAKLLNIKPLSRDYVRKKAVISLFELLDYFIKEA
ncbi:MAG: CinA family protein [Ruminococcaceae bacterium]|nr:CinA family protein [Oscillospiraceae bacterium]